MMTQSRTKKHPCNIFTCHMPSLIAQYASHIYICTIYGNHSEHILWPITLPNPQSYICQSHDTNTWPRLLSTCIKKCIKDLRIARHNKAVHLINQTYIQINKFTRFATLVIACLINHTHPNSNNLGPAPQLHMQRHAMPMHDKTHNKHPMHTWSPKSKLTTNTPILHTYNPIA